MPECNVENMAKFVMALESGQYEQGTGTLRRNDKFCCLGVACDVAVKAGAPISVGERQGCTCGICTAAPMTEYDGESGVLPRSVAEWLGIGTTNPRLAGASATSWNDGLGATFPVIAQLFRHTYLGEA